MKQIEDFLTECEALSAVLVPLDDDDFARPTQFKGWRIEDVIVHLYFWNLQADQSIFWPEKFSKTIAHILPDIQQRGMRPVESESITLRGMALLETWRDHFRDFCARLDGVDPKMRVKWAGPDMSIRSSITARQMETWAHGHEVFDCLGKSRVETDRIENIVILGVNTFGWSHKVQGLGVPEQRPYLKLTAPSGQIWEYGDIDLQNAVIGSAVSFAQVVTQTRNVADTDLKMTGYIAQRWMETAQCFAGGKELPPAQGARSVQQG
ncbi:MAG: TIGR03084 family metal-binding protein [Paracoccaceae bacterium]|jgi:uncharacterized protein (TIGR03084 family)